MSGTPLLADAVVATGKGARALVRLPDGSTLVSFRAGGLLEMCWHLYTWGANVEVLQPPELKTMMRQALGHRNFRPSSDPSLSHRTVPSCHRPQENWIAREGRLCVTLVAFMEEAKTIPNQSYPAARLSNDKICYPGGNTPHLWGNSIY